MKKFFLKIRALFLLPVLGMTVACDDWFTLLPQSEMVAEDFWKDEQDVLSGVGACYRAMNEDGFMRRLIVWGEVRSDNVVPGTGSDTDLGYILNANINAANGYVKWSEVYTVINICNTLIKNAPMVREYDSDFTEEHLKQYLAEAKTIRAFCYFTLVRAFNDVPYLWLNDYENCIAYCDKILASRDNPLTLLPSSNFSNAVFYSGNSDESIWELQFDNNTQNGAVRTFYGGTDVNALLSAYDLSAGSDFFGGLDLRHVQGYVGDGLYAIKKYVAYCSAQDYENPIFGYGDGSNNWIIYRLPDVYLMKAEALAEIGGAANLEEAVDLVSYTYDRAHPDLEEGSLKGKYTNQSEVRNLVFDERQREFLFEGKRYFDLVRRMRREGSPTNIVNTYLMRKYTSMSLDETTVRSKLDDKDAIYLPIHEEELRVNPLLVQNRFYMASEDISKN